MDPKVGVADRGQQRSGSHGIGGIGLREVDGCVDVVASQCDVWEVHEVVTSRQFDVRRDFVAQGQVEFGDIGELIFSSGADITSLTEDTTWVGDRRATSRRWRNGGDGDAIDRDAVSHVAQADLCECSEGPTTAVEFAR